MINSQKKDYRTNKLIQTYKVIENLVFIILMAIMSLLILMTAQSRLTGKEPSLLGHRVYIVESGSMEPALMTNSMILVKELDWKEVKEGDIITYYGNSKGIRVTHRAMEVDLESKTIRTKGDANNTEDPSLLKGENLIGKVVFKIPYIGIILRLLGTKAMIAFLVSLGFIWILLPKLSENKNGK